MHRKHCTVNLYKVHFGKTTQKSTRRNWVDLLRMVLRYMYGRTYQLLHTYIRCAQTTVTKVILGSITTELYWDCKCNKKYITPKYIPVCHKCHAHRDEMPDSMIDEVNDMIIAITNGLWSRYNG